MNSCNGSFQDFLNYQLFIFVAAFNDYSFKWLLLLTATSFPTWYSHIWEYFLVTVLFVKTKEMPVKKFALLLRPSSAIFWEKTCCSFLKIGLGELKQMKMIIFMFCFSGLLYTYYTQIFHRHVGCCAIDM